MTPAKKTNAIQEDAATLAFWHAAETGNVVELESLLPQVDINACNEHGVTALMRAAQHGHAQIVRALLQNGADANIKRNDKFTALALAAFFGHTEVVRTLMAFGADSQAATRNGTSPQMWATARTFNAVVKSLQKPASAKADIAPQRFSVPAPAPARVFEPAPAPETSAPRPVSMEIRTLKEPPEIWDLVHEESRRFDARSAFMTRLQSMRSGWAFRVTAATMVIALSVVGVIVLRNVQARSERNSARQAEASPQIRPVTNNGWQPVTEKSSQPPTAVVPAPPADNSTTTATIAASDPAVAVRKQGSRSSFMNSHRLQRSALRGDVADEVAPSPALVTEKPDTSPRSTAVANKPATPSPLSPQMISPPKSTTPKGKVIQWP